jgi:hypothetical protein
VGTLSKSLLLFLMNWLDAQLTLLWINLNVATEGNALMARILNHGEGSFLGVKLLVGAFAALILYRCSRFPIARRGLSLVLGVYMLLMVVHTITGAYAFGWDAPGVVLSYFGGLPGSALSRVF